MIGITGGSAFAGSLGPVTVTALVCGTAALRGVWSPCGLSMISAINPMSERARGHRYGLTAAWFVIGALVGGALLGALGAAGAALVAPIAGSTGPLFAVALVCCLLTQASDGEAIGDRRRVTCWTPSESRRPGPLRFGACRS